MEGAGAPGAGSLWGSTGLPLDRWEFSAESQKPVERRQEETVSLGAGVAGGVGVGPWGSRGSLYFTAPGAVFPSWTVLGLCHHFLQQEGTPHEILPAVLGWGQAAVLTGSASALSLCM